MDFKLELKPIPVSDADRAKRFYGDECGFVVDLDHQISDSLRIVQLTPAGSSCSIVLGTGTDKPPGSVRRFEDGGWKGGHGGRWNSFAFFDDPHGNGWVLQGRPAE